MPTHISGTFELVPPCVRRAVEDYVPSTLADAPWTWAGRPVRERVLRTNPTTVTSARGRMTTLCRFLAWGPWNRCTTPDLDELLTPSEVHRFRVAMEATTLTPGTVKVYSRRLEIVRLGEPTSGVNARPADGLNDPVRLALARTVASFAPLSALLAAVRAVDIPVSWLARSRFPPLLDITGVRAEPDRTAAVSLPEDATRTLWLLQPSVLEVAVSHTPPADPSTVKLPKPGKRMSNKDALKFAAAQKARRLALTATQLVEPPVLDPEVARIIARFRPITIADATWQEIAPVVRLAVTYYDPPKSCARNVMSVLAKYAEFLHTRPRPSGSGPLRVEDLVQEANIRWWKDVSYPSERSRSTAASYLNGLARKATGREKPTDIARDGQEPYTLWEATEVRRALLYQKGDGLNRASCFLGACCLGAGLNSRDLRPLRARDIAERTLSDGTVVFVITVTAKGREREAVVMRQYEPMMRRALDLHAELGRGRDDLVLGVDEERAAIAYPVLARVALYGEAKKIRLDVNRMRATWMVSAMSAPIPLIDLLHAAGVQSARMFVALTAYCPKPDPDHVEHLVRLPHTAQATWSDTTTGKEPR